MAADLTHATLVRNPDYERNGLKSYVRALHKYGITPTVAGPYCLASKPESDVQGTFTDHSGKILTQEFQLVKRDAETAHAGTVPVRLTDLERTDVAMDSVDANAKTRPRTSNTTPSTSQKSELAIHRSPSS